MNEYIYEMEISIYFDDNSVDINVQRKTVEVCRDMIDVLRSELNGIIIDTVEKFKKQSGDYRVYAEYTENGELIDVDDFSCYVNVEDRIIMY